MGAQMAKERVALFEIDGDRALHVSVTHRSFRRRHEA